jgi:hypothetical protein
LRHTHASDQPAEASDRNQSVSGGQGGIGCPLTAGVDTSWFVYFRGGRIWPATTSAASRPPRLTRKIVAEPVTRPSKPATNKAPVAYALFSFRRADMWKSLLLGPKTQSARPGDRSWAGHARRARRLNLRGDQGQGQSKGYCLGRRRPRLQRKLHREYHTTVCAWVVTFDDGLRGRLLLAEPGTPFLIDGSCSVGAAPNTYHWGYGSADGPAPRSAGNMEWPRVTGRAVDLPVTFANDQGLLAQLSQVDNGEGDALRMIFRQRLPAEPAAVTGDAGLPRDAVLLRTDPDPADAGLRLPTQWADAEGEVRAHRG